MYITVCNLKIRICSGSAFPFHPIILLNFLYHCPNNLRFDVSSESLVDETSIVFPHPLLSQWNCFGSGHSHCQPGPATHESVLLPSLSPPDASHHEGHSQTPSVPDIWPPGLPGQFRPRFRASARDRCPGRPSLSGGSVRRHIRSASKRLPAQTATHRSLTAHDGRRLPAAARVQ